MRAALLAVLLVTQWPEWLQQHFEEGDRDQRRAREMTCHRELPLDQRCVWRRQK